MSGTEAVPQESKDQAAGCYRRSPRGSRRDMTPWGQCWGELARGEAFVKLHQHPLVCAERQAAPSLPDTPARVSSSRGSAGTAPTRVTLAGSRAGGSGVSSHPELLLLVLSLWSTKHC